MNLASVISAVFIAIVALQTNSSAALEIPQPQIPHTTFAITDYGAVGDGVTMNTAAITKAIDACGKSGGGVVEISTGRFLTGPLVLTSNLELHLDKGATLLLSNRFDDFPTDAKGNYINQIVATGCHDLAITGDGTIDGQGEPWWKEFLKTKNAPVDVPHLGHRPFMVVLRDCTRVLVRDVTLSNSPSFHLVPQGCRDVTIDHVHIQAPADAPNTDGMDPSGWNFQITNCTFDVGDDCIAIKPTGKSPAGHVSCEDFLIANCTFKHGHGMSIGGQTPGGLRHLVVRDCTFTDTDAGIRMKANRGAGGLVEDCVYENLTMTNVKTPIYITSYYPEHGTPKSPGDDPAKPIEPTTPIWRNIHIRNVTATGGKVAGRIIGLPEMPVSDVELMNVKITAEKPMVIWNAKDIRFVTSQINVDEKSAAIDVEQSSGVMGLDLKTGEPQ